MCSRPSTLIRKSTCSSGTTVSLRKRNIGVALRWTGSRSAGGTLDRVSMPACTLPRHLGPVAGDETATRGCRPAAHGETRVACRAADGIETPDEPGALPGPRLPLVGGREDVRRAINDETHVHRRAASIEERLLRCLMLSDRPVATVAGGQDVGPRLATAGRDARVDARAHDRVEEVWRHRLKRPATTALSQNDAMADLVSHGVAMRAGRACHVHGAKPACLLPAAAAVMRLESVGGHAAGDCGAGDGERWWVLQARARPGHSP